MAIGPNGEAFSIYSGWEHLTPKGQPVFGSVSNLLTATNFVEQKLGLASLKMPDMPSSPLGSKGGHIAGLFGGK